LVLFICSRREAFGTSGTAFYQLDVLPVTKPRVLKHGRKCVEALTLTIGLASFFLHCQTVEGRDIAAFMPATSVDAVFLRNIPH